MTKFTLKAVRLTVLTRGEPSSDGGGADVPGELEHGPLGVGPAGDDEDVGGVLDGGDGPGGQAHLLPRLVDVDDVDTVVCNNHNWIFLCL